MRLLTTALLSFMMIFAEAQDCENQLEQAQKQYEIGQFQEALDFIQDCATSREVQVQWKSLRMQAMCYLALNENAKAKQSAVQMLRLNPQYIPSPLNDPAELIRLIESIDIIPTWSLGLSLSIGSNYSVPSASNIHLIANQQKTYSGRGGLQFGISSVWQINKSIALESELRVLEKRFKIDYTTGSWNFNYKEKLSYLSLPMGMRFYLSQTKNFKPYVRGGFYISRLLFSENSFEANHVGKEFNYSLMNASSAARRNPWEAGAQLGFGFVKKTGSGQIFAEIQYLHSFNTINDPSTRMNFSQLQSDYLYIEDDIILHSFAVNLGYRLHLNYKVLDK